MRYKINGTAFFIRWIAAAVFVWPMAILLMGILAIPVGMFFGLAGASSNPSDSIFALIVFAGIGATIGYSVGRLQRWLLQNRLYWEAEGWLKWSTFGGLLGTGLVVLLSVISGQNEDNFVLGLMPIFMLGVAAAQWRLLRHIVSNAWLWIFANVIAGIVFSGILSMNLPSAYSNDYEITLLGMWLLGALVQGAITGYVMLFLFEKKLHPMESKDLFEEEPKSVWDRAI